MLISRGYWINVIIGFWNGKFYLVQVFFNEHFTVRVKILNRCVEIGYDFLSAQTMKMWAIIENPINVRTTTIIIRIWIDFQNSAIKFLLWCFPFAIIYRWNYNFYKSMLRKIQEYVWIWLKYV